MVPKVLYDRTKDLDQMVSVLKKAFIAFKICEADIQDILESHVNFHFDLMLHFWAERLNLESISHLLTYFYSLHV